MTLSKKQILSLIFIIGLVLILPFVIFLTKKRQDIRPRAAQGQADLLLSSDAPNNTASVGQNVNVLVSLIMKQPNIKASGVDFVLLYDSSKLQVTNVVPALQSVGLPVSNFTDAPIVTYSGTYDTTYNYLRVAEVVRMQYAYLPTGVFTLARVTFRLISPGAAIVKFPDDNRYIQIVGSGT